MRATAAGYLFTVCAMRGISSILRPTLGIKPRVVPHRRVQDRHVILYFFVSVLFCTQTSPSKATPRHRRSAVKLCCSPLRHCSTPVIALKFRGRKRPYAYAIPARYRRLLARLVYYTAHLCAHLHVSPKSQKPLLIESNQKKALLWCFNIKMATSTTYRYIIKVSMFSEELININDPRVLIINNSIGFFMQACGAESP